MTHSNSFLSHFIYFIILGWVVSLKLFIVLDDLVEFRKLAFLIFSELLHNEGLGVDAIAHLLFELLDWSFHPMFVIFCWLNLFICELQLNLRPDFPDLEMGVHLHNLHFLLLVCIKVILVETNPIKNTKNYQTNVILLDFLLDPVHQVSFHTCLCQVFQESLLLLQKGLLDVFRHQWFLLVSDNSWLVLDSKSLVFFWIKLKQKLSGV